MDETSKPSTGGGKPQVQALVYIFIGIVGVAVAATAYFGLTFTPIESVLAGFVGVALCVVLFERTLRRRSEARLERGIEDLSRLLSTDAQAGQVLSQRINELANAEPGPRLDALEGDVSVLGTVVQQIAEAVADIEKQQEQMTVAAPQVQRVPMNDKFDASPDSDMAGASPLLSLLEVQRAVQDERLELHVQPIVTLPQRRTMAFDLLPLIQLDNGEYADALDFTPRKGGEGVVQQVEHLAWEKAFRIVRRARGGGNPVSVNIPLSRATLADPGAVERALSELDSNSAVAKDLVFVVSERQWRSFNAMERHALASIVERGVGISVSHINTLRLDFAEIAANGVSSIRVDATRFINQPETYTDFHSSDVAAYVARYDIDFIVSGVHSEQQVLTVLEDGVKFALGSHIAPAGPMPSGFPLGATFGVPEKKRVRARG